MITSFIRNYFVIAVVLFITDWFLPNVSFGYQVGRAFTLENFFAHLPVLLVTALVLTLLTLFARPVLQLISAPINFLTLGLFNVVINVFIFWLATYLVDGFTISDLVIGNFHLNSFFSYCAVALVFGFLQGFLAMIF
ncbi:phage holin family protein [bacterium]|nr:phage holin family protein [bacterium]